MSVTLLAGPALVSREERASTGVSEDPNPPRQIDRRSRGTFVHVIRHFCYLDRCFSFFGGYSVFSKRILKSP